VIQFVFFTRCLRDRLMWHVVDTFYMLTKAIYLVVYICLTLSVYNVLYVVLTSVDCINRLHDS